MENTKLKELTDRLYGEGLEKGRAEAERLVAEATATAAKKYLSKYRIIE